MHFKQKQIIYIFLLSLVVRHCTLRRGSFWVKSCCELGSFISSDEVSASIVKGEVGGSENEDVVGRMGDNNNADPNSFILSNAAVEGGNSI